MIWFILKIWYGLKRKLGLLDEDILTPGDFDKATKIAQEST